MVYCSNMFPVSRSYVFSKMTRRVAANRNSAVYRTLTVSTKVYIFSCIETNSYSPLSNIGLNRTSIFLIIFRFNVTDVINIHFNLTEQEGSARCRC